MLESGRSLYLSGPACRPPGPGQAAAVPEPAAGLAHARPVVDRYDLTVDSVAAVAESEFQIAAAPSAPLPDASASGLPPPHAGLPLHWGRTYF